MIAGLGAFAWNEQDFVEPNAQCSKHWAFFIRSSYYSESQGGLDESVNTAIIFLHRDSLL
jgi:hypothetical protein